MTNARWWSGWAMRQGDSQADAKAAEIVAHYTESYDESERLKDGFGQLERARTLELIARYLPEPPSVGVNEGT